MSKPKGLSRAAHKVRPHKDYGTVSWWYENAKSIDVYVRDEADGRTRACRIRRADLADWLKRSEALQ